MTLPNASPLVRESGRASGRTRGPAPARATQAQSRLLLGTGLILIALNLRPIFSSLSAVLPEIMRGLSISPSTASLMTTLPVLCLGLFAPAAPVLARRFGTERTILGLLGILAMGTALRGLATLPGLLGGSVLAGGAIAIVNVLLPGLVKRDFPDRTALMTGLYTTAICAGGALAAGLTVPLEAALGGSWPGALAIWAVPALAMAALWAPWSIAAGPAAQGERIPVRGLWRDPLAWQITLFMGLQSALAYCVFGWLAPLLRERGLDGATAGYVVSTTVVTQMIACLVLPAIAVRCRTQRVVGLLVLAGSVFGFLGLALAPLPFVWAFALLQGIGQGGMLAVAMTLIILRSPDGRVAAQLSGMVQGVGYTLASCGPLVMGFIREATGSFTATAWLFGGIGLLAAIAVMGAGRPRFVQTT